MPGVFEDWESGRGAVNVTRKGQQAQKKRICKADARKEKLEFGAPAKWQVLEARSNRLLGVARCVRTKGAPAKHLSETEAHG